MRTRNEMLLLLAGIAIGAVVGGAIGLVISFLAPAYGFVTFFCAIFGSYIGMLVADRRRLAMRRAAAGTATRRPASRDRRPRR